MENIIIGLVLVVLLAEALRRTKRHFKRGCCGSASTVRSKKILTEPKLGEKTLLIQGMHCENCQARIENGLNRIDGVACRVNLRKKTAKVDYSRAVSNEELVAAVEKLGYQVTEIH